MYDKTAAKKMFYALYMRLIGPDVPNTVAALQIDCNSQSLSRTLDFSETNSDHINASVIISFCHHFSIPSELVFYPEEYGYDPDKMQSDNTNLRKYSIVEYSQNSMPLPVKNYSNCFYGYCHSTTGDQIDSFQLKFTDESRQTKAVMKLHAHNNYDDDRKYTDKLLSGNAVLLKPNTIVVFLQDLDSDSQKDDLFIMVMEDQMAFPQTRKNPSCCRGAMITLHRHSDRYPELQAFALFDKPYCENDENLKILKGFLKLSREIFYLKEKDFEKICSEWEEAYGENIREFLSDKNTIPVFKFSKSDILHLMLKDSDGNRRREDEAKLMLMMKEKSLTEDKIDVKSASDTAVEKLLKDLCAE